MAKFNTDEYNREKYKSFLFRVDRQKDQAIIAKLEQEQNIAGYVRSLIEKDLADHGEEKERL